MTKLCISEPMLQERGKKPNLIIQKLGKGIEKVVGLINFMNGCNFFWKQCKLSKPSFLKSQLVGQDKVGTFKNVGYNGKEWTKRG